METLLRWTCALFFLLTGCGRVCPLPAVHDGPLLKNGDFEFSEADICREWLGSLHPSVRFETKEGRSGSCCLVLQTQGKGWDCAGHVFQSIDGTFPKGHVAARVWIRTKGKVRGVLSCQALEDIYHRSRSLSEACSESVSSEEWRQVEVDCPVPAGTSMLWVGLSLDVEGHGGPQGWTPAKDAQGQVFFDDVEAIFTADKP